MKLTLLGTAAASGIPVYGCDCSVCQSAEKDPKQRRQKTSAMFTHHGRKLLIDANADDFMRRFPNGSYDGILLTHFHMDHVIALFDIRWGVGEKIPVYTPNDNQGADDLFKHSGLLDFRIKPPFVPFQWQDITITPIALNHSRPTHGYVFDYNQQRIAYLTDTAWLSDETLDWLRQQPITHLLLDTSHPPSEKTPRNHHDINQAIQLFALLQPHKMGLIHVTHEMLAWAAQHPEVFNEQFYIASDGEVIKLHSIAN